MFIDINLLSVDQMACTYYFHDLYSFLPKFLFIMINSGDRVVVVVGLVVY